MRFANTMGLLGLVALAALALQGCVLFERADPEYLTQTRQAVEKAEAFAANAEATMLKAEENVAKLEALAEKFGQEQVAEELAEAQEFLAKQRERVPEAQRFLADMRTLAEEAEKKAKEEGGVSWAELILMLGEGGLAAFGLSGWARAVGTARRMIGGIQAARAGVDEPTDEIIKAALDKALDDRDKRFVDASKAKLRIPSVTDSR